jgi:hypothetical protein
MRASKVAAALIIDDSGEIVKAHFVAEGLALVTDQVSVDVLVSGWWKLFREVWRQQ